VAVRLRKWLELQRESATRSFCLVRVPEATPILRVPQARARPGVVSSVARGEAVRCRITAWPNGRGTEARAGLADEVMAAEQGDEADER